MAQLEKADSLVLMDRQWGWVLGLGVILLLLGVIGLGMEFFLTIASMYFFAVLLIISGLSHSIDAFKYKKVKGAMWQILIAVLYLCAGIIVFYDPVLASAVITALLAWMLIIIGASRIFMAFYLKGNIGWGWMIFSGLTSVVLGLLILLQWPLSGLWVIGMFIAIELIIIGWSYIFMALSLRRA